MMADEKLLQAIQVISQATPAITAQFGTNFQYARLPINTDWPLVHFFDVVEVQGYKVDYDSMVVQFSIWELDRYKALQAKGIIKDVYTRYNGTVSLAGGDSIEINYSTLTDSGALPTDDVKLFGEFIRVDFRYRGNNL